MNTPSTIQRTATERTTILAIDLGKYKSVVCIYERTTAEVRFTTLDTSRAELAKLLLREQPGVVVIEACTLAGWVYELCVELGLACKVANTSAEAWKFKHSKRKTDKDDALKLTQLEALGELPTVPVPAKRIREWRTLIRARQTLVARRVAIQNRLRALLLGQGLPAPRGHRAWTELGLRGIEQYARPLAECGAEDLWRGVLALLLVELRQVIELIAATESKLDALAKREKSVQLLATIPGVGPRTAETVSAYLDNANRFTKGKQVSAYGGLVPRQYQSGEQDRRGRITRRGPALLRKMLVECAWCMLRYNAWARSVYQSRRAGNARRQDAQEAGDRGVSAEAIGALLGDAA